MFAAQAANERQFEWAMQTGVTMVILQVGAHFVTWTYDKVKRYWGPEVPIEQPSDIQPSSIASEPFPQRPQQLAEKFDKAEDKDDQVDKDIAEFEASRRPMTREEADWAKRSNDSVQQPQPQVAVQQQASTSTGAPGHLTQLQLASRQIQRAEVGQPPLPVDNHAINDDHDHDNDPASSSNAAPLVFKSRGKRPLGQQTGDLVWDNDPWQAEKQQLLQMIEQLQAQVSKLETTNAKATTTNTADIARTPMVKSIFTPITPVKDEYADVIDFNEINNAKDTDNKTTITAGVIRRPRQSPSTDSSSDYGNRGGTTPGLYRVEKGGGDQGGDGDDDPSDGNCSNGNGTTGRNFNNGSRKTDFILVKSSNITITTFSGSNLSSNPYLPFYKAIKRLIYNQGEGGELLLELLTEVEKSGADQFTNANYKELIRQCPKATEFNRALMSVLLNYTTGIAKGLVEYGAENGFDAWRRLYHHYLPLAEDLQQLLIQELYSLPPVNEANIDTLFNKVERITEMYTKAGRVDDAISEKWIKAVVLRNLPKNVTKDLAMQLRDVKTVNEVRNVINIYFHDHQIGMPRGHAGPMLCLNAEEQQTGTDKTVTIPNTSITISNNSEDTGKEANKDKDKDWYGKGDLNAAYKGKGKKGSKGYGECWHCGEWGHPRRECPHLNDPTKAKGAIAALKVGKAGGGKVKGKYGKGGKGKGNGKGKWGKGYNYQYRSPGKGVGKGFNELNDDWYSAWGGENTNDYDYN